MIASFASHFLRTLAQSPSLRSIILAVAALSGAALYDARFSISDLHTNPAYVAPVLHAFTINALNRVTQRLFLNLLSPHVLRLSSSSPRLYSLFLSTSLEEPYPSFHPTLLPLPFLLFLLLLIPPTFSSSLQYHSSSTLIHSNCHRLVLPHTIIHSTLAMV